jgi:WD40 repeat protein
VWDGDLRHRLGVLNGIYTGPHETEQAAAVALAFSPDGRTLVVAGSSGSVKMWDVASGRRMGSPLTMPGQDVHDVAFLGGVLGPGRVGPCPGRLTSLHASSGAATATMASRDP